MTVTSQTTKTTTQGNSSARTFSFSPMVIFASTDIVVTSTVRATGVETTLSEGTTSSTYSVGITTYPATGSITYPHTGGTLVPSTVDITIKRVLTLEQQTDLNNQGGYFAETQEEQFDKLAMLDLQQQEIIDRSFAFPIGYTGSASTEIPAPVASTPLAWNATATALENATASTLQPLDATLTAFAAYNTNGLITQTSADTFTGRTITGTSNKITVSYGNGVSGNPTLSIPDAVTLVTPTITGVSTHGSNIVSDTDSTDDLGTTSVRWANLFVDAITATDNAAVGGNLTVTGNLTVNGTTVTHNATNLLLEDPLILLNKGLGSGDTNASDLGLYMERGDAADAFMGFDESSDVFTVGHTTSGHDTAGNLTITAAPFTCSAITATSGTLAGITSLGLSAGATITAGILDEDAMGSDSAVALATQQSIKAYVDSSSKAAGISMTWETTTTDTDQGVGKVWTNNATLSSATVLYFDDVERNSVSINALIDTLDDPTATNSATIYIQEAGSATAGVLFKVSGSVTSASTYSKVAVTHQATFGTLSDGDVVGVTFAFSGDDGEDGAGSGTVTQINAGDGFSFSAITSTGTIAVDGVLQDLDALGAPSSDGQFIVATGSGAFNYESGATAFTSIKQDASTSATGVSELATTAETITGTDTARVVTPAGLHGALAGLTDATITASDTIIFADTGSSNALKEDTVQGILDLVPSAGATAWTEVDLVATTSGDDIEILSGMSGITEFKLFFEAVSQDGTDNLLVQLSDGSYETSGYDGQSAEAAGAGTDGISSTAGAIIYKAGHASYNMEGVVHGILIDASAYTWMVTHSIGTSEVANPVGSSFIDLDSDLVAVRVSTVSSAAFDAGGISGMYR